MLGRRRYTLAPVTDEEAIRRTIAQYCHFCDDGRFDEWADLFTTDARFTVMGSTHEGRNAVKAFIEQGQPPERRGKHVCFNSVIDVDAGGSEARAWTDYVFVSRRGEGGFALANPTSAGRYHDRLVRDQGDGRWRFAERRIVFLGDE